MAGMIKINEEGKIWHVSDESGHNQPGPSNMYNFIKTITENRKISDVFAQDAEIQIHGEKSCSVTDFINKMEIIDSKGAPLHQRLKDQKAAALESYAQFIKGRTTFVIEADRSVNIGDLIENLSPTKLEELSYALTKPNLYIVHKDPDRSIRFNLDATQSYKIEDVTSDLIKDHKVKAFKKLLDAGISERKDFINQRPLNLAISADDTQIANALLNDSNIKEILRAENNSEMPNSLHQIAQKGKDEDIKIINEILKHPEGRELLNKKDVSGKTPLELAEISGNVEVIAVLRQGAKLQEAAQAFDKNKETNNRARSNSFSSESTNRSHSPRPRKGSQPNFPSSQFDH